MPRKSITERNNKRAEMIKLYRARRHALKQSIKDKTITLAERYALVMKLHDLPKDSSRVRYRNRCNITSRPRGYYRYVGLSRNMLRELASQGLIGGLIKSNC